MKGNRMKYGWAAVLLSGLLALPAFASDGGVRVLLDGSDLLFDVPPVVSEGRTLVPFRTIFEALGYEVEWDGGNGVQAHSTQHQVELTLGEGEMKVDGESVPLDVPPIAAEGRTLVPLRAVAEASGCDVFWDGERQSVLLWREGALPPYFTYSNLTTDGVYLYAYLPVDGERWTVRISLSDLSSQVLPVHCVSVQSHDGDLYGRFGFEKHLLAFGVLDMDTYIGTDLTDGNEGDCFVYGDRFYNSLSSWALDGSDPQDLPAGLPFYFTLRDGKAFGGNEVLDLQSGETLALLESDPTEDGRRDYVPGNGCDLRGGWYYVPFGGYLDEGHHLSPRGVTAWNYETGERIFYPVQEVMEGIQVSGDSLLYTTYRANGGALLRQSLSTGETELLQEDVYTYEFLAIGDFVYYTHPDLGLCRCPIAGGTEEVIWPYEA